MLRSSAAVGVQKRPFSSSLINYDDLSVSNTSAKLPDISWNAFNISGSKCSGKVLPSPSVMIRNALSWSKAGL